METFTLHESFGAMEREIYLSLQAMLLLTCNGYGPISLRADSRPLAGLISCRQIKFTSLSLRSTRMMPQRKIKVTDFLFQL